MRITPLDIRKQEFRKTMRGLDTDEVYAFLGTVADEYEAVLSDNKRMREHIVQLENRLDEFKNMETNLRNTLLTAEKVTAEAKDNARKEADLIVRGAEVEAEKAAESIRAQTQQLRREILELKKHKDNYIARLRTLLESHMRVVDGFEEDYAEVDREIEAIGRKVEEDTRSAVSSPRMSREKITEDLPKSPEEDKVTWGDEEPGEDSERPTFPRPGQWEQKNSPDREEDSAGGHSGESSEAGDRISADMQAQNVERDTAGEAGPAGTPAAMDFGGGPVEAPSGDDSPLTTPTGDDARAEQPSPRGASMPSGGGTGGSENSPAGTIPGQRQAQSQDAHARQGGGRNAPPVYASPSEDGPAQAAGPSVHDEKVSGQSATGTAVETEQQPGPGTKVEESSPEIDSGPRTEDARPAEAGGDAQERPDDWRSYEVRDNKPDWSGYEIAGQPGGSDAAPRAQGSGTQNAGTQDAGTQNAGTQGAGVQGAGTQDAGTQGGETGKPGPAVDQPTDHEVEQALSGLTDSPERPGAGQQGPPAPPAGEQRRDIEPPSGDAVGGRETPGREAAQDRKQEAGQASPQEEAAKGEEPGHAPEETPSENTWSMEDLRRNLTNIDRDDE